MENVLRRCRFESYCLSLHEVVVLKCAWVATPASLRGYTVKAWVHVAKISPFHGEDAGSNPVHFALFEGMVV